MELFQKLTLICLSPEQNQNTCNYWYTITTNVATPHTAFNTEAGLRKWLAERGLSVKEDLPERGTWAVFKIDGAYYKNAMLDKEAFDAIVQTNAQKIKVLDNAEFTLGALTKDEHGLTTVNYLNCNIRDRLVYDYQESREVLEPFVGDDLRTGRPRG
jgi:hypothetical protein